ncbi:glycosyltransferase family 2 protein [Candidatus Marinimicrobia bacterium]|nr:glycosyltransferase family 2 protein [Candidatus Neomarinimicrobiota bacterium]
MNKIRLSIIIPCYNEAENIPKLIENLKLINNDFVEIILVDNGSIDGTKNIIDKNIVFKSPAVKSFRINKNIGYGHGIMSGVKLAKGDVISWTHADLQTDINDVIGAYEIFINKTKSKDKFILKGIRKKRNFFDAFFTFGMGVLVSYLLRMKLFDINAQPKMFHKSFLKNFKDAPSDFSLDLYFLYVAKTNNYDILEYPVFFHKRYKGQSKGGGSIKGKWSLIKRTWKYIFALRNTLK